MQAWLRLAPGEGNTTTNGERYGIDYPNVDFEYLHLPSFLDEAGPVSSGVNGATPLSHLEIESWARLMHITLEPFEAQAMRLMSISYAAIANDPNADCPVESQFIRESRSAVNMEGWIAFGKAQASKAQASKAQ